jgi:hypothetical protein
LEEKPRAMIDTRERNSSLEFRLIEGRAFQSVEYGLPRAVETFLAVLD